MSLVPIPENAIEKLYPLGRRVELSDGSVVEIRKWSISTLARITQRVPQIVDRMRDMSPESKVTDLLPLILTEVEFVIAETVPSWPEERVRAEMSAEDALILAEAIWDVCLAPLMGKLAGLVKRLGSLAGQPAAEGPSLSSPTATL
jgi:hypothetical protein